MTVYMAARNNSSVRIRRVYAELTENFRLQAGRTSRLSSRSLARVEFPLIPDLAKKTPSNFFGQLQVDEMEVQNEIQRGGHAVQLSVPTVRNCEFGQNKSMIGSRMAYIVIVNPPFICR
jgi:hypothetical protein